MCTCDPQPHSTWSPCSCAPAIQAAGHLGPQDHPRVPASAPGRGPTRLAMGLSHLASLSGSLHVPTAHWALLPRQRGRPLPAPLVWNWEGVVQTKRSIAPSCPRRGSRGGWCASDSQRRPPPRPTSAATFPPDCPLSTGSFLPHADHAPASPGPVQGSHCSGPEPRRPPEGTLGPCGARLAGLVSVKQMTPSDRAQGGPARPELWQPDWVQKEHPSLLGWGLGSSAPFSRISESGNLRARGALRCHQTSPP